MTQFINAIQESQAIWRLGWTLLHTLWVAAAVAAAYAVALGVLRRRWANARYLTGCIALALMVALPVAVFFVIAAPPAPGGATAVEAGGDSIMTVARPVITPPIAPIEAPAPPVVAVHREPAPPAHEPGPAAQQPPLLERFSKAVSPALPWIVLFWAGGVVAVALWQLGGWIAAQRLKRLATQPTDRPLAEAVARLARAMRVSRPVKVLESMLVRVPTVIGWLRPVILLPAGVATGLTPQQLEAILAHELAHIRRYDYLVNLLQSLAETLLFYHPAVWWVSRRVRTERENCCDDVAVAAGAERFCYAESLLHLAQRSGPARRRRRLPHAAAVAATGRPSQLRTRVSRLLTPTDQTTRLARSWPVALTFLVAIFVTTALFVNVGAEPPSQAEKVRTSADSTAQLELQWRVLAEVDPRKGFAAVLELEQAGDRAAAFLATKLEPVAAADAKQVAGLIAQLSASEFATRQRASEALSLIGISIEEALHQALRTTKDPEVRSRLNELIASAYSPVPTMAPAWRRLRAIRALERIGTPQARALLGALAAGAADARATQQAAAALRRLGRGDKIDSPTWWLARAEEEAELWGVQDQPAHSFARIAKVLADAGHIEAALALTRRADDATARREATYRIAAAYARARNLKAANRLATLVSYPVGQAEVRCRIGVALARTGQVEPTVPPQSSADWIAATAGHPPANWPRRSPSKWQVPEHTLKSVRARIHAAIAVAHATAGRREAYREHIKQAESLANGIPGDINRMADVSGPTVDWKGSNTTHLWYKARALEAAMLARGAAGDHDGAIRLLKSIPAGASRDGIARGLVKTLAEAGAWKPANAVLELIADRDEAYLWMLAARARAGDLDEAKALYERVRKQEGTHRLLGRMHLAAGGDRAGKAADYGEVLRDAAGLSWLPARTYRRLARIQAGTRPRADILNWIRALPKPRLRFHAFLGAAEGLFARPDRRGHAAASPIPTPPAVRQGSSQATQPGDDGQAKRIADSIGQLGSAEYKEREAAQAALVKIGLPAVPALQDARKDSDLERAKRARAALEQIEEAAWGEANQGLRVRVRPLRSVWKAGQTPELALDIRNGGQVGVEYSNAARLYCQVQVDGQWYGGSMPAGTLIGMLKPGKERTLKIQLTDSWATPPPGPMTKDIRWLVFAPGRHVVQISFTGYPKLGKREGGIRCISNPVYVEFEGLPATQPATQPAADAAQIERLIKQLGSDKFTEREQAQGALVRLGQPAVTALVAAGKSADAEIGSRARQALREIGVRTRSTYFQGQVLAPDSKPAAKARVTAIVWWRDPSGRKPYEVGGHLTYFFRTVEMVCDQAGRFEGRCLSDGPFKDPALDVELQAVAWSADGTLCGYGGGKCKWPESVVPPLRFSLAKPGAAKVRVMGAENQVVPAADVVVEDQFINPDRHNLGLPKPRLGWKVQSSGDGNYEISGLVPGREYRLFVSAPKANPSALTRCFNVKPGETFDAGTLKIGLAPSDTPTATAPAVRDTSPQTVPEASPQATQPAENGAGDPTNPATGRQ